MQYILYGLLVTVLTGCMANSSAVSNESGNNSRDKVLVIDLRNGIASSNGSKWKVTDCSNEESYCIDVQGLFGAIFPKKCSDRTVSRTGLDHFGEFRSVGVAPHYGLPFGSYVSERYKNVLVYYNPDNALGEIRIFSSPAFGPQFDQKLYLVEYKIRSDRNSGMFKCKW